MLRKCVQNFIHLLIHTPSFTSSLPYSPLSSFPSPFTSNSCQNGGPLGPSGCMSPPSPVSSIFYLLFFYKKNYSDRIRRGYTLSLSLSLSPFFLSSLFPSPVLLFSFLFFSLLFFSFRFVFSAIAYQIHSQTWGPLSLY
jgi:hypothetical protein